LVDDEADISVTWSRAFSTTECFRPEPRADSDSRWRKSSIAGRPLWFFFFDIWRQGSKPTAALLEQSADHPDLPVV